MNPEEQLKALEERVKQIEGVLFGFTNDVRFKSKVRDQIFDDKEHVAGKPTIVNKNGKKYNLQTV